MALYPFTASTDLTTKGKRLASFNNGSITGPIMLQVQLNTTTSQSVAYTQAGLPTFPAGLYVEVTGTGFNTGCVDLV